MTKSGKSLRILLYSVRHYDWSRFLPRSMDRRKLSWAARSMTHPLSEYMAVKREGHGSLLLANLLCAATFVVACMEYFWEGFVFNYRESANFNLLVTLLSSVLLLLLWSISSWCVCSLLDGEGSFRETWITTCYAMLPRVLFTPPLILLSNALTMDEQNLYHTVSALLLVWCGMLLMLGMLVVQQYSLKKTIAAMLLTVAGIAIILFIGVLFTSMFQQFWSFLQTIVKELWYRS